MSGAAHAHFGAARTLLMHVYGQKPQTYIYWSGKWAVREKRMSGYNFCRACNKDINFKTWMIISTRRIPVQHYYTSTMVKSSVGLVYRPGMRGLGFGV